jgi:hypothetical protein
MAFAGEEQKVVSEKYEQGIIHKSNSPWSSPLVLMVKENGKLRPCVDYRRLNGVTVKDVSRTVWILYVGQHYSVFST